MTSAVAAESRAVKAGREKIAYSLVLAAAVLAVFSAVRNYPPLGLDDERILFENPIVSTGLTVEGISWAFRTMSLTYWQPIPLISHMAAVTAFGLDPGWHHLVNLALHAMNTLLLFFALCEMTGRAGRSALVAAIFGIHPLQVAPVAWIPARTDLLAASFFLMALLSHARGAKDPRRRRYPTTTALLGLGLMSKPTVVTLPLVLLLVDFWPLGRWPLPCAGSAPETVRASSASLRRLLLEKVPLAALAVAAAAMAFVTRERAGVLASTDAYSLYTRLRTLPYYYARLVRESLFPAGIEFYPVHPGPDLPSWKVLASVAAVAAVTAAAVVWRKRFPFLAAGWAWFAVMLVPVAGLVQVGDDALAARYMYLPLIGLALAFVWGAAEVASAIGVDRLGKAAASIALLAALGASGYSQIGYWKSGIELFARDVELDPRNYLARNNLGLALRTKGRYQEAVSSFMEARRLRPDRPFILGNIGVTLFQAGRREEAIECLMETVNREPHNVDLRFNLGLAYYHSGRFAEARTEFRRIVAMDPGQESAMELLRLMGPSPEGTSRP